MSDASLTSNLEWEDDKNVDEAIAGLRRQDTLFELDQFGPDIANEIGEGIRAYIEKSHPGKSALISIRLWSGLTLYQSVVGTGVSPTNEDWARRKANTVRVYGKSSFLVGRELVAKGRDINSLGPEFAAHGGAFPIRVRNNVAGPVGVFIVSGLKQAEDHRAITDVIMARIPAEKLKLQ